MLSTHKKQRSFDLGFEYPAENRAHDIAPLLAAAAPRTQVWPSASVLDQQSEGACAAFSGIGLLQCQPTQTAKDYGFAECIEQIYWPAQRCDQYQGGAYPGAATHMDGTSLNAVARVLKQKGLIKSYRWSFNRDNFRSGIIQHGPAHIGVKIYEGMMATSISGWIKPTGTCYGGHALYVAGYVHAKKPYYIIQNSWGKSWGGWYFKHPGRCRISEEDLFNLLFDQRGQALFYTI
jgi:hypothetical protein